jgi:hypothetical protein
VSWTTGSGGNALWRFHKGATEQAVCRIGKQFSPWPR